MNRYKITCYDRSRHEDVHVVVEAPTAEDAWFIADKRTGGSVDGMGARLVTPKDIEIVSAERIITLTTTTMRERDSLFDRIFGRW